MLLDTSGIIPLSSPLVSLRAMQKKYATGRPDQKDLNENLAATQGLAHMIMECNRLFEVRPSEGDRSLNIEPASGQCFYLWKALF